MWTHVDRGGGRDFFVDVINGWPLIKIRTYCIVPICFASASESLGKWIAVNLQLSHLFVLIGGYGDKDRLWKRESEDGATAAAAAGGGAVTTDWDDVDTRLIPMHRVQDDLSIYHHRSVQCITYSAVVSRYKAHSRSHRTPNYHHISHIKSPCWQQSHKNESIRLTPSWYLIELFTIQAIRST